MLHGPEGITRPYCSQWASPGTTRPGRWPYLPTPASRSEGLFPNQQCVCCGLPVLIPGQLTCSAILGMSPMVFPLCGRAISFSDHLWCPLPHLLVVMTLSSSYSCILLMGERAAEDTVSAPLLGRTTGAAEHEME